MTDLIVPESIDPDKLTQKQKRTLELIGEALLLDIPRTTVARYIADRDGVSVWTIYKRLERLGFDLKGIPKKPKPLSEQKQWELDNPGMKRCVKCGKSKPATTEYFRVENRNTSGLHSQCRRCARMQAKQYRDNNPDKIREFRRTYRVNNPDKARDRDRKYHLDLMRINPDRVRAYRQNRRARKLQNGGNHTAADIQAQYKSQRGKCWWCGKKVGDKYHVDHRVPLARGGSNAPENLVIACPKCNLSKGARLPHEWGDRLL